MMEHGIPSSSNPTLTVSPILNGGLSSHLPTRRKGQVQMNYCTINDIPSRKLTRSDVSTGSLDSGFEGDFNAKPNVGTDIKKLEVISNQSGRRLSQYASEMSPYNIKSCLLERQMSSRSMKDEAGIRESKSNKSETLLRNVSVRQADIDNLVESVMKLLDQPKSPNGQNTLEVAATTKGKLSHRRASSSLVRPEHSELMDSRRRKLSLPNLCREGALSSLNEENKTKNVKKSSFLTKPQGGDSWPSRNVFLVKTSMSKKIQERKRFSEILGVSLLAFFQEFALYYQGIIWPLE